MKEGKKIYERKTENQRAKQNQTEIKGKNKQKLTEQNTTKQKKTTI